MAEKKHDGPKHTGSAKSSPYGLSRLAPAIALVDVAEEIQKADHMVGTVVGSKLEVIAEQIRRLQEDAREILERAKRDLDLHRAGCSFPRRPGHVYHLYERSEDVRYWSMVSPEEWGKHAPHSFIGSYRLEADQSWTAIDGDARAGVVDARAVVQRLLSGG